LSAVSHALQDIRLQPSLRFLCCASVKGAKQNRRVIGMTAEGSETLELINNPICYCCRAGSELLGGGVGVNIVPLFVGALSAGYLSSHGRVHQIMAQPRPRIVVARGDTNSLLN